MGPLNNFKKIISSYTGAKGNKAKYKLLKKNLSGGSSVVLTELYYSNMAKVPSTNRLGVKTFKIQNIRRINQQMK